VGTSRRSLKSFPPFGETIVIIPTRKDKAHSLPIPKGRGIPRRFDEEGKVYVLNFTGCPATNIYTTNSFQKSE